MTTKSPRTGRPRSAAARDAVLHAVDDLLVEQGYAAMTLKGIAERAGVSRQTLYRWWSTKAEILFEASWLDAAGELAVPDSGGPATQVSAFLDGLIRFLTNSPAGAAYRALLGEAQHDKSVAALIASRDILGDSAATVISRTVGSSAIPIGEATARLIGPTFYWILSGRDPRQLDTSDLADRFLVDLK
ncbi:TetR/AcrR family transcriptional regulator [Gordonia sp. N1V]|uniref:TetR/AcrR family transcriptional regulator n=1 Tax=Gordonia sp. N1V TaxID=3034163 RepID=UPI0023E1C6F0|nr:TetR/AcrR family transcriptional regulator [Gordonia sp. N1V]MDF3284537.1 TetR/AcrR family transcriptional regulator [Gordonia sp. N1V]